MRRNGARLINTAADLRLAQTAHYYSKVDEYND